MINYSFFHKNFVPLRLASKVLTFENPQIKFGFLLIYSYL